MAGFIQLIEFEASDIEAVEAALERFRDEHPDVFTSTASTTTEDRDRPGTYISIVEFASYEKAMEQSDNASLGGRRPARPAHERPAEVPQPRRAAGDLTGT